jgi:diguanylate cyclase (GGDEF)-like protein
VVKVTVNGIEKVSINVMIARGIAAAVTVAGYLMVYPVIQFYDDMVETRQQQINSHALSISHKVSDALQYLSQTSQQIVSTREVKDMAMLGDSQEIEAWSFATRRLFPKSFGLGILSEQGDYIGDRNTLRIGEQCAADTVLYLDGDLQRYPPIHTSSPELKHFDILHEIMDDDGDISGLLLMSFHLSMIQDILDRYAEAGYTYELRSKAGIPIAKHGQEKYPYVKPINLPGTDWVLSVSADDKLSKESWRLIQFGSATLMVVFVLFVLVAWLYVSRQLKSDIERVKRLLSYRYLDDEHDPLIDSEIRLSEIAELLSDIDQLAEDVTETRSQLELRACTDKLTGLLNRRGFEEDRAKLYRLASRQTVVLVVLDVDYFKQVNDTYGHAAGDRVLTVLGELLSAKIRSTDKAYRLGGDELLVVFTSDNTDNLQHWYKILSEEFSRELATLEESDTDGSSFTLSAGATIIDHKKDQSFNEAMVRADGALYQAKDEGRARMVIA